MKIYNVQEAKTHLSRILEEVAAGEEVLIGKHGRPMARLTSVEFKEEKRPLGGLEREITLSKDFNEEDDRINKLFQ